MSWTARRRLDGVVLSLTAPTITSAAVQLLVKPLVAPQVPGSTLFNYPSGHVVVATSLALGLALIVSSARTRPAIKALAGLAAGLLVLVVAWIRLVGTAQFLSDVVGGVATGADVTLVTALLLDRRPRRAAGTLTSFRAAGVRRSTCRGGRLRNRDPSVVAASDSGGKR